ncbi:MAG: proline--tRNA ligase [Burkholderiales bacterium]|jgi:prolyl-tRNA synthetase|nr:proline--tRNA ligase [Burkholderiales bacterium]
MRLSQFFLNTLKEAPAEADIESQKLMLRAGMIKKASSGIYNWLPLGLITLRKVEAVVREEMNRAGAQELLMPNVVPAELWQETGRWDKFGPQLLKIRDRHDRDFLFGPTHEEVITDIVRKDIRSYRQLPVNLYQIQTKFRDEIRPRFGVMRAREFIMKDAYSFDLDKEGMKKSYQTMYDAYSRIFTRLGLKFRAVAADNGAIGGTASHEFQVLADSGEDVIAYCPASDYAANIELAEAVLPTIARAAPRLEKTRVATPGKTSCEDVAAFLNVPLSQMVKCLMIVAEQNDKSQPVMCLIRGDHTLNEVKLSKLFKNWRWAGDTEIIDALGTKPGYLGPVDLPMSIPLIADRSVPVMSDFVCGANEEGFHLTGVNFARDAREPDVIVDIRNVEKGDLSPDGKGTLDLLRGIEVGHVFALGNVYATAMGATYLDDQGQSHVIEMGCYGIGITRIVAAAIEQNHDERGIIWSDAMAPFTVAIAPIGYDRSENVREMAHKLYEDLKNRGVEVLLDDRGERPGVMFADLELIGIPHRITVGERGLKNGEVEYRSRREESPESVKIDQIIDFIQKHLKI